MLHTDDPHRLANIFLEKYQHADGCILQWYKQQWYCWIGRKYIDWSDEQIRADINLACEAEFTRIYEEKLESIKPDSPPPTKQKVTGALVSNVRAAVQSICIIPDFVEAPCWIDGPHKEDCTPSFIPVRNGIIDVRQIDGDGQATLMPHTPLYFAFVCLPMEYSPSKTCPQWLKFLSTNLELDEPENLDKADMLRQWFGYCMVPDPSMQKFLMMEGEGKNGKSVICAALTALLGEPNVSHVTLEAFGERFALGATVGKLANIAAEVGDLDRVAEGHLKQFTSGDRMTIDRKNKNPIHVLPTARLVLATNNRPRFGDKSGGIWRRMLLLKLTYEVNEDERVFGMDSPRFWGAEASGILNWALMGLAELRSYRRFTEPEESKRELEEYRNETNPAREFLKERYEWIGGEHYFVETMSMYDAYKKWSEARGYQPVNARNLGKEISRLWRKVGKVRKGKDGDRFWAYVGIREIEDNSTKFDTSEF